MNPSLGKWALRFLAAFLICMGAIMALSLSFEFQRYVLGGFLILGGGCIIIGK